MVNIFKDKKFLKDCAITLIIGIFINAFCFFIGSCHVNAASPLDDFPFAIGVPQNIAIPSSVVNQAINEYISILSGQYGYDGSAGALCFLDTSDGNRYWLICCDSLAINISNYPSSFTYSCDHQHWVQFVYDSSTGVLSNGNFYGGYVGSWTFSPTSLSVGHGWVLGSVPNNLYSTDNTLIWTKSSDSITGHARPTDPPEKEDIDDPPTPPTWQDLPHTVPPTLNDSIQDWLSYVGSEINRLGRELSINISNLAEFIADSFNYAIQKLIDNVHNFMTNLVDNIKSFFQPILESIESAIDDIKGFISDIVLFVEYITEPFSASAVSSHLQSLSFYSDFNSLKNYESSISSLFDISEPSEYSLVIHLENIDDDFISRAGAQSIDISFLHESSVFRAFCWVIVCSGLTFIVASGIPSMLRGDKGD